MNSNTHSAGTSGELTGLAAVVRDLRRLADADPADYGRELRGILDRACGRRSSASDPG